MNFKKFLQTAQNFTTPLPEPDYSIRQEDSKQCLLSFLNVILDFSLKLTRSMYFVVVVDD